MINLPCVQRKIEVATYAYLRRFIGRQRELASRAGLSGWVSRSGLGRRGAGARQDGEAVHIEDGQLGGPPIEGG